MYSWPTLTKNDLLKSLLGKKIVAVKRQLFMPDIEYGLSKEAADGPIELTFEDDAKVYFEDLATYQTVEMSGGEMRKYGESYQPYNCSHTAFWEMRRNSPIRTIQILRESVSIQILRGSISTENAGFLEPAVKFTLANGEVFYIEYVSNEKAMDTIRLAEQPESSDYQLVDLN